MPRRRMGYEQWVALGQTLRRLRRTLRRMRPAFSTGRPSVAARQLAARIRALQLIYDEFALVFSIIHDEL